MLFGINSYVYYSFSSIFPMNRTFQNGFQSQCVSILFEYFKPNLHQCRYSACDLVLHWNDNFWQIHSGISFACLAQYYWCKLKINSRSNPRKAINFHIYFKCKYQLLMAEAILALYSNNCWSFFNSSRTKRNLHWIIQVIGSIMAIVGTVILMPGRLSHFKTIHGITGLVSLISAVVALANGVAALWPRAIQRRFRIRPVVSKIFHNLIGISTFVLGTVSTELNLFVF